MREGCERCGARLAAADEAYICSYECTFCATCAAALSNSCGNCQNELVRRPRKVQACNICESLQGESAAIQVE
ncbi:MAG: DUF1272 domain-containing protein [Acidobacteriaceae bacterium]